MTSQFKSTQNSDSHFEMFNQWLIFFVLYRINPLQEWSNTNRQRKENERQQERATEKAKDHMWTTKKIKTSIVHRCFVYISLSFRFALANAWCERKFRILITVAFADTFRFRGSKRKRKSGGLPGRQERKLNIWSDEMKRKKLTCFCFKTPSKRIS